jgi:histidinol phosphatase-like enzyme
MTDALARSGAPVQAVLVCPHDEHACSCRKPALGLFQIAQRRFPDVDFSRAAVIGDSWRDMKAANDLGAWALLIGDPDALGLSDPIRIDGFAPSLLEMVKRFVVSADPTA